MSDVDHVQSLELLFIQNKKERLIEVIASLNEKNNYLQQQIQVLRQGIPSSSSSETLIRSSEYLFKDLIDLNAKEIELEQLKKTLSTYEIEINILRDHIGGKERHLKKLQGSKAKVTRGI